MDKQKPILSISQNMPSLGIKVLNKNYMMSRLLHLLLACCGVVAHEQCESPASKRLVVLLGTVLAPRNPCESALFAVGK